MPNDYHTQFSTLISQGCSLFASLQQTLADEHSALEQRDLEALKLSTDSKHQLLLQIEANIRERNEILTLAGQSPSQAGFENFTAELPATMRKQTMSDWQQLKQLLDDVRIASKQNEQILTRSKQNVNQLLALLQGQVESNVLYDPAGSKDNYTAQRSIGKA